MIFPQFKQVIITVPLFPILILESIPGRIGFLHFLHINLRKRIGCFNLYLRQISLASSMYLLLFLEQAGQLFTTFSKSIFTRSFAIFLLSSLNVLFFIYSPPTLVRRAGFEPAITSFLLPVLEGWGPNQTRRTPHRN